jgi:hypothetical protein
VSVCVCACYIECYAVSAKRNQEFHLLMLRRIKEVAWENRRVFCVPTLG